jgi:hypothetical protein
VTLLDEEASTRMLKFFSTATLLLLGIAGSLAYLFSDFNKLLLTPAALICLLALCAHISILRGRTHLAGQLLIWGTWAIILASAPFGSGNRSIGMVAIPLLIFVKGWLGGARRAIGMTMMTIMALLGISLCEHYNWIPQTGPVPPPFALADALCHFHHLGVFHPVVPSSVPEALFRASTTRHHPGPGNGTQPHHAGRRGSRGSLSLRQQ